MKEVAGASPDDPTTSDMVTAAGSSSPGDHADRFASDWRR